MIHFCNFIGINVLLYDRKILLIEEKINIKFFLRYFYILSQFDAIEMSSSKLKLEKIKNKITVEVAQ